MFESLCFVIRATITKDVRNGQVYTLNQNLTLAYAPNGVPCSVQETSYATVQYYAQRNQDVDGTIHTALDLGAEPNDIIRVTDRTGLVVNFRVRGLNQKVGRARLWEYYCVSMRQAGIAVATNTQGVSS